MARTERICNSPCGSGKQVCELSTWGACDAPLPKPPTITAVIRDFHPHPPDFERPDITNSVDDRGIIATDLGADDTPVFLPTGSSLTIDGPASFARWFHDTPGENQTSTIKLVFSDRGGTPPLYEYANDLFFPIDGQLFGNEGLTHNYSFTVAGKFDFYYMGGETFSFSGDDDMWVYINRKLAIDLGGLHSVESASIRLDDRAFELGLTQGQRYTLHFFFAERHTTDSHFTIRTTLADLGSCE